MSPSMGPARWLAVLLSVLLLAACTDAAQDEQAEQEVDDERPTTGEAVHGGGVFSDIPDVVEQLEPSVVTIVTPGGTGSGVVYRADGVVVTNAHVVGDASTVMVTLATGDDVEGRVTATDRVTDLAVVEVDRELAPASFETDLPRVGELVIALGSPLGFEKSATAGIVSGLSREIPGSARQTRALVDLIQTDAAISPGNSGGALVDAEGRVVGINEAYLPPATGAVSIGFAIPSGTVVETVEELLEDGTAEHPFVGIRPLRLTPYTAQALGLDPTTAGVAVGAVVEAGPADEAGIRAGDVIVAMAGEELETVEEFLGVLRQVDPDDTVDVTVLRGEERRSFTLRVGRLAP